MLIWKGIEFRTKGIIVEKTPDISKGEKRITTYDIPGRNGFLSVDEGTYNSFVVSVECHAREEVNFNEICEFLDGYGTLSFDGEKEYTAIIQNAIPFSKVQMFKKFVIEFLVNPIAEDITETTFDALNARELTIEDNYSIIYPVIELTGIGDVSITINGRTFYLNDIDGDYMLDCKNKVITHNMLNASSSMNGDFPSLMSGMNLIDYTGDITSLTIKYKKTYLIGV